MKYIKATITKFISTDQPGFVECSFTDAHNREWKFIEKIPVVTDEAVREDSPFPMKGYIAPPQSSYKEL
ncbi:MAG: hypothetical protein GY754_45805 [bacterium]|nr:hypothetical protein [bacterium]